MAGETVITYIGQLTADPELRFTASGAAVANFTVVSTPRTFNKQENQWKDGEPLFIRASAWRDLAENVAETLKRGDRVIIEGELKARTFTTKEGENRTVFELDVREIGPSLKWATAQVTKVKRDGNRGGNNGGGNQGGNSGGDNPWANSAPANNNNEPPF